MCINYSKTCNGCLKLTTIKEPNCTHCRGFGNCPYYKNIDEYYVCNTCINDEYNYKIRKNTCCIII